jgi:hypothetical protein
VEGKDGDNPSVDACTGGDIRVRYHPFDIPAIDLYYQIPDSDDIEMMQVERTIESVDLKLQLGVF